MKNMLKILMLLSLVMTSCKNESEDRFSGDTSFEVQINQTLEKLLAQEDTDGDKKITIEDKSPKVFELKTNSGNTFEIKEHSNYQNCSKSWFWQKKKVKPLPISRPNI